MTDVNQGVEFKGVVYTEDSLKELPHENLLELRNDVAVTLGLQPLTAFKQPEAGIQATWRALTKFSNQVNTKTDTAEILKDSVKKPKKTGIRAPKKEYVPGEVKGVQPALIKRPTRSLFRKIKFLSTPLKCTMRLHNYKDGMTVIETYLGKDMTPNDIRFWIKEGWVTLVEPTEDEIKAGFEKFYRDNGYSEDRIEGLVAAAMREDKTKTDGKIC